MYLPLHNARDKQTITRVSVKLCFFIVSMPLIAFIVCLLVTMHKDFEKANNTHCNVPNIFPSISACIGSFEPQSTIWKVAIYFHAPFRFFILYLRWGHYRQVIRKNCALVVDIAVVFNTIENFALLGLTHWTSLNYYSYHEISFKIFIGSSLVYMLLTCIMMTNYKRRPSISYREKHSVKLKWRTFIIYVTSFACAAYFFLRHNKLCEPYVYSLFGFSEYIVVMSNILFHLTTIYDLHIQYIYITKYGVYAQ